MTREEILKMDAIAFMYDLGGIEIKHIEYDIFKDRIYCVSNAWYSKPTTHKVQIHYADEPYIMLYGQRFNLNEAIRL